MRRASLAVAVWAALAVGAALVLVRAHYSAGLSAFLPRTPTAAQRLLIEQLRQGVASRLILIAIGGSDAATRARLSGALAARLAGDPGFASVDNGAAAAARRDAAFLFAHRYLLSDTVTARRFTVAGLRAAIGNTLDLLASGLPASSLRSDPTGEMLSVLGALSGERPPHSSHGVWASPDGRLALLLARTRAPGVDTDAQARAIQAIRRAFASARVRLHAHASLELTGPGVFAVAARANIERQILVLSGVSGALIVTLLLLAYRSLTALALGLIPVASGALAGVAAVALHFGVVQGVTLGFGATLIGEAVDYSIYFLIQSQRSSPAARGRGPPGERAWLRSVWPTLRLGMLTSVFGFASLLPSSFPGLAQLGLYSLSGVLAAALVTRFVLPVLLPRRFALRDLTPIGRAAQRLLPRAGLARLALLALAALSVTVLYRNRDHLWNRQLSALSPVPAAAQRLDARLRADLGAPDVRYLAVVSAPRMQSALSGAEQAGAELDALVKRNVIAGYQSPARYLPSLAVQRQRQKSLPPPQVLRGRLQRALSGLPLPASALAPFLHDVAEARSAPLLRRRDLSGTSFASALGALLIRDGRQWRALLPLSAPASGPHRFSIDISQVRRALSVSAPAHLAVLDLKSETDALYSTYLREAVKYSLFGLAAIVLLLLAALRSPARVARVVLPLALAVLTVAAGLSALGVRLTLLHVIGMLLIVAVGSNYALFLERPSENPPLTLASLLIANAATVLGFGVLAFSTVPVLADLGATVAPGALLALVFAVVLARKPAPAGGDGLG